MIKVKLVRVSACAVLVLGLNSISRSSYATSIVDTGSDSFGPSWSFYNGQNFGGEIFTQYFAGEFSVLTDTNITQVEGFLGNQFGTDGFVTANLHEANGDILGTTLFSTNFALAGQSSLDWHGVSGLNWLVTSGTYWLAFVPDANIRGTWPGGVPSPLNRYVKNNGADWQDVGSHLDIGIRISGDQVSAVPLPAALPLFARGLAGLGWLSRRRRKQAAA